MRAVRPLALLAFVLGSSGALVAACSLWLNGEPPLIMDLRARHDYDHVVALFRRGGCWGAISKSNHLALRGRDPVFRTLRELKARDIWVIGTAGEASEDLYTAQWPTSGVAWVMGAEGDGMRRLTRETCDALVHIPMGGSVDSLNVSVAAGVCLFEAVRRRRV